MLTQEQFQLSMQKANKVSINPYVKVRKGGKEKVGDAWLEKALVYVDQRGIYEILNTGFGTGNWHSEEWVSPDGKSVGVSIIFPILLDNGNIYQISFSSVADLIYNTKSITDKDGKYIIAPELLAECGIPLSYMGGKLSVLDTEEAVKGAASRAIVRAATKFLDSIANLYTFKSLHYTSSGKAPNLAAINFNAPELGHQDDDAVVENVVPTPPVVELANKELINQLVEVATQLEKDSKKKMQLVIDTINHIAEELGETPPTFDTSSGGAFKKALSEFVDAEGLTLVIEQLKAKLEPAKPAKASKSDPKA